MMMHMLIVSFMFEIFDLSGLRYRIEIDWTPEHGVVMIDRCFRSVEFSVLANVKDDTPRCDLRIGYII